MLKDFSGIKKIPILFLPCVTYIQAILFYKTFNLNLQNFSYLNMAFGSSKPVSKSMSWVTLLPLLVEGLVPQKLWLLM